MKEIILAGGCFWGVEAYFKQLKGVLNTSVGYVDGNYRNPSYKDVCSSKATHTEACQVFYEPSQISLEGILDHFFRIINPYSLNRQGPDIGSQYRSGIYYVDLDDQKQIQLFMEKKFQNDLHLVKTVIKQAVDYDLAEAYHQDYLDKNPNGYCHVNLGLATNEEKK